jgi:hypothetical protein
MWLTRCSRPWAFSLTGSWDRHSDICTSSRSSGGSSNRSSPVAARRYPSLSSFKPIEGEGASPSFMIHHSLPLDRQGRPALDRLLPIAKDTCGIPAQASPGRRAALEGMTASTSRPGRLCSSDCRRAFAVLKKGASRSTCITTPESPFSESVVPRQLKGVKRHQTPGITEIQGLRPLPNEPGCIRRG